MRRFKFVFCILILQLFNIGLAAQSDRSTITGTVVDSTGAVVPSTEVTATNINTGMVTKAETNREGIYSVLNLPPGAYKLTFTKTGFKLVEYPRLTLIVAQVALMNVTLVPGGAAEVVTVTEEAPLLRTQTTETGTNLKHIVVNDLPLSVDGGRRLELFAYAVTPSVEGNDWWSNVAGSQAFTKEVVIDGTSANAQIQGDLMESSPSMDAVQEFEVQTSGFTAENSRTGGGVFLFNLKSGSNRWHGAAGYYLHNELFDANTWDNGWQMDSCQAATPGSPACGKFRKPMARFSDYALSGGGPIIKNKMFFYASFERFLQRDFRLGSLTQTVPTADFLNGNFGALLGSTLCTQTDGSIAACSGGGTPINVQNNAGQAIPLQAGMIFDPSTGNVFTNNVIPSDRISTVAKQIVGLYQKYYPPAGSLLFNNNALTLGNSPRQTPIESSIKVDHRFNEKNQLSTSWIYNLRNRTLVDSGGIWSPGIENGGPLARSRQQSVVSNQWRASDSHSFTPLVLNVASATYNEYKNASRSLASGGNWPSVLGFGSTGAGNFPEINFGADRNGWNESGIGYASAGGYVGATYILNDTLTWVKGRHTLKFGGDFRAMQINSAAPTGTMHFTFSPDQTGNPSAPYATEVGFGFASMMLGAVQTASMDTPFRLYGRRKYMALFAQDDIKANRKLTLNLGLRWEATLPFHEKYGHWGNFDQTANNPLWGMPGMLEFANGGGDTFEKNRDWTQFSPHLGAAYQVSNKIVARGSYAITYVPMGIDYWFGVPYGFAPGYRGTNLVPQNGTNAAFNWDSGYPGVFVPGTKDPNNIPWGPVSIDPNSLKQGYIHQFSTGIQYELTRDLKIDINYLGNRGRRLHEGTLDYNELDASSYLNWYNQYSAQAYNWVWDSTTAAAAGVPWYPANPYGAYMAYQAMSKFPQVSMLYGPLYYVGTPRGKSAYDALQVEVTKRAGRGLMTDFSYVYSKTRGNVMTNFDELWYNGSIQDYSKLDQEAGVLLPYDQKHVFKGYVSYDLPFGRGQRLLSASNGFVNNLVGGWKIGAVLRYNTGQPITLSSTNYYPGWAAVYPNISSSADLSSHFGAGQYTPWDPNWTGAQYFNPNIATNPANGTFGTGPVRLDGLRGFGRAYEDANLMKSFYFGLEDQYRLTVRFQLYNIFNRHYYADPNGTVPQPGTVNSPFGNVTSLTGSPRQGQFDVRFQF
jgi:hypothetical protein